VASTYNDVIPFWAHRPLGIHVSQLTYGLRGSPALILQFDITNVNTNRILNDVYIGLFADVDVPDGAMDVATNDVVTVDRTTRLLLHSKHQDRPTTCVGLFLLSHESSALAYWNSQNDPVEDSTSYGLLRSATSTSTTTPADYRSLVAAGPFSLTPAATESIVFGFVQASDKPRLRRAVTFASDFYARNHSQMQIEPSVASKTPGEMEVPDDTNPAAPTLISSFPNPFNPTTQIEFDIPAQQFVTIRVYDVLGREVRNLVNDLLTRSHHAIAWDGTNNDGIEMATGIYLVRLAAGEYVQVKKMMLVR
jgi:hypothetical protein